MKNVYKLDFSYENLKKIYEKRSKKLFSEHLAHYNKTYLIKQNRKNTCLLTSVYNVFPMLFDYDENKYIKLNNKNYTPNMIKELFGEDKILIIDKPELPLKENILT